MAPHDDDQSVLAFREVAAAVMEQVGVIAIAGASGFALLANELAPDLPFEAFDEIDLLMRRAVASDGPLLLLPPWGGEADRDPAWELLATATHEIVLLLPRTNLERRVFDRVRRTGSPSLVLVGRLDGPGSFTNLEAALVVLGATSDGHLTRFFSVPREVGPDLVTSDFQRLLQQQGGATKFGFVLRGQDLTGQLWRPEDYDPAIGHSIEDLAEFGHGGVISDVFDVLKPDRRCKEDNSARAGVRVITAMDLGKNGRLRGLESHQPRGDGSVATRDVWVTPALQAGDLLLSSVEASWFPKSPVEVTEGDLPAVARSGTVIALRAREPLTEQHRAFYKYYLASQRFRVVARPRSFAGMKILHELQDVALPQPDSDLLEAIADLQRAGESFASWSAEGNELSAEAFDGDAARSRQRLLEKGRLLRQREEAARAVGSFDHQVANFYPTPVAAQFRQVRVRQSAGNDRETYDAILDCCETALAFTASLALAFAWVNSLEVKAMAEIRKKLSHGRGGVSMGDWVNVLKEVASSRTFRNVDDAAPLALLRSALPENSPAAQAQERLKRRRDAKSHQRGADDLALQTDLSEALRDLETLLKHLVILTDLPIFHVEETRWDAFRQEGTAKVRWLRGDHPMSMIEHMTHTDSEMEAGSLYVKDINGAHVLLRPFVVRHQCHECHTWSTFCPDHREDGRLRLRALDHSHSIDGEPFIDTLEEVGFVERQPGG